MLAGHQAEICHQLAGIAEAAEVAHFRNNRDGRHQGDPAHRLQHSDDGGPSTSSAALPRSAVSAGHVWLRHPRRRGSNLAARSAGPDAGNVLWSASAGRLGSRHEPRGRPGHGAAESLANAAAPWTAPALRSLVPAPDRGSLRVWHQGSRSQLTRVAAIRLDPVARFHRDQRGRHHDAAMPPAGQKTVKPVTARTHFAAEAQATAALAEPCRHLCTDSRGGFSNTPTCRTSTPRPLSATAT
jgi:hypothetical protein